MLEKLDIRWFYAIGVVSSALTFLAFFNGIYFIPLIPMGLVLIWWAANRTDQFVLFLAFLVPLSIPLDDVGFGLGMSLPTEPLIAVVFGLVIFKILIGGRFDKQLLKHPITLWVIFHMVWLLVSALAGVDVVVSVKYFLSHSWFLLLFYFFLLQLFKKEKWIMYFLWCMILGTAVMVFYTVLRHAGEGFVRSHSYTIMRPFFQNHGIYAAAIAFFVPILAIFLFDFKGFKYHWIVRTAIAGILGLLLLGIIFSYTRATWVSLVAVIGFYILLLFRVRFRTLVFFLIAGIAFVVVNQDQLFYDMSANKQGSDDDLEGHVQSISNVSTDPSNLERINRWHCAVEMFKERPIFGFGPANYVNHYAPYQRVEDLTLISTHSGDLGNVHSEYFAALSETGLPGFVGYLMIFLLSISRGMKIFYNSNKSRIRSLALGTMLGLLTYLVHGFLNNYNEYDKIAVPLWGFVAILAALDVYHYKSVEDSKLH